MIVKKLTVATLTSLWRPGSHDWTWPEEHDDLWTREPDVMRGLVADIALHGILEPVLLGPDWRLWDGHHRIAAVFSHRTFPVPCTISGSD